MLQALAATLLFLSAQLPHADDRCERGDIKACFEMGKAYLTGEGVPKDLDRAAALLTRGCEGGAPSACSLLGDMFARGWGGKKDEARAIELYKRSCDGRNGTGCHHLGQMFEFGHGVRSSLEDARKLYELSCTLGNPEGCESLGLMYGKGRPVARDDVRAAELFVKACDLGLPRGCVDAAKTLHIGNVPRDETRVSELLTRACNEHYEDGCVLLTKLREERSASKPYRPATLEDVRKSWLDVLQVAETWTNLSDEYQFEVTVTYMGAERARSRESTQILQLLNEAQREIHNRNSSLLQDYTREALFREGDREYWMLIGNALLPRLETELKVGDKVMLKVRLVGAVKQSSTPVFLVNDYSR